MNQQLDDIRDNITVNTVRKLKDTIIDCAKEIKSNDVTFQISTLPSVSAKLSSLMDGYSSTLKQLDTCQQAFLSVHELVEVDEDESGERDFIDLDDYLTVFKQNHDHAKSKYKKDNSAKSDLTKVLRPVANDEEIQVEAPQGQIPKDPITKKDIVFAMRSKVCKHVFDKTSIEDYISQCESASKTRIKCPLAGCTNKNLSRKELEPDQEINKLIQSM